MLVPFEPSCLFSAFVLNFGADVWLDSIRKIADQLETPGPHQWPEIPSPGPHVVAF